MERSHYQPKTPHISAQTSARVYMLWYNNPLVLNAAFISIPCVTVASRDLLRSRDFLDRAKRLNKSKHRCPSICGRPQHPLSRAVWEKWRQNRDVLVQRENNDSTERWNATLVWHNQRRKLFSDIALDGCGSIAVCYRWIPIRFTMEKCIQKWKLGKMLIALTVTFSHFPLMKRAGLQTP